MENETYWQKAERHLSAASVESRPQEDRATDALVGAGYAVLALAEIANVIAGGGGRKTW